MPDVLVRNLSNETVEALKARAKRHGRSLQKEVVLGLEKIAHDQEVDFVSLADEIRERIRARQGTLSDSTELIREDRDNR